MCWLKKIEFKENIILGRFATYYRYYETYSSRGGQVCRIVRCVNNIMMMMIIILLYFYELVKKKKYNNRHSSKTCIFYHHHYYYSCTAYLLIYE